MPCARPAKPGVDRFSANHPHRLYACLQLILPGEQASEHRHTQSALRLVLEGKGGITTVNGGRVRMMPGDFIITPSWVWHGHTHECDTPMIWLDDGRKQRGG
ncbi:MAG: cupin domain-containing protein [Alphaproteobacteria bacterium]